MASKLDVAVIVALAAGCALWIEQGHRVVIDAPTQSELAAAAAAAEAAAACPRNDDVPYSANCLAFLFGPNWQPNVAAPAPPPLAELTLPGSPPPCPDRDNVPYDAGCLAYLQGATTIGMRWRVSAPAMPAPVHAPSPVAVATSMPERPRDVK
jgi:hypothetical protein